LRSARFFLAAFTLAAAGCSAGGKGAPEATGGDPSTWGTGGTTSVVVGTGGTLGGGNAPGTGGAQYGTGGISVIGLLPDGGKLPYGGYDPTVAFEWPQAQGSTTGTCKAGHYHGSFIGIYSPGIAVFPAPIPVAGDIDLTLTKASSGEYFDITGGKVSGVADGLFPFSADVIGTLNCTTGKLEGASLKNGVYLVGPLPASFEGPLVADYNKLTQAFANCTWEVGEPTWPRQLYGGSGTWEATWTGP
jgi:hypothetical protein